MKISYRNKLDREADLRSALSVNDPQIKHMVFKKQLPYIFRINVTYLKILSVLLIVFLIWKQGGASFVRIVKGGVYRKV